MTTGVKSNHYQKRRDARLRWSRNAVLAKERNRIERANAPIPDKANFKPIKLPRIPFDVRVRLERRDGGTVNFTLRNFYGKLVGSGVNMAPKQFGRRLGEIIHLWIKN
jgi:hypothetical protein